jgi:hypothetical protein
MFLLCAKTYLHASVISKNFPGVLPRTLVRKVRGRWEGTVDLGRKEQGREGDGKGREKREEKASRGRDGAQK